MKKTKTYCYYAISDAIKKHILSDQYCTRKEVVEFMHSRGFFPCEYIVVCLCEEWQGESPLRVGRGLTQKEARQDLR